MKIKSVKHAISLYLITSYLYYVRDISMVSDYEFDMLCSYILDHWEERHTHPHYILLELDMLKAGSGYHVTEDNVPWGIKSAAIGWLNDTK